MYHRWWNGSQWGGWENLGGAILEAPNCVSWGSNRIDCFARGTDKAMYHRWWNGSQWGGWENLEGAILEAPNCVSWGSNRIDCFARGTDSAMYHRWWNGSQWGGWENLEGAILEAPNCVSWGSNRIDCFARGTDKAMYHRWWPCPACGIASRQITISRHNTVTLTNAQVDSILTLASTVLQNNDGAGDVACRVAITRSGDMSVFNTGDGSIDSQAELSEIFNLPGNVKVVDDVNFCAGTFNTSYIGCGQRPGTSFITEPFTASLEGILWAHEFGHNQGLPHRDTSTDNVMYFSIGSNRQRINQTECDSFLGSGGTVAETSATGARVPVKEFVSQIYFDGLPLDRAATYGEEDAGLLLTMLNDPSQVQYHENIALTLGMIGSEQATDSLISYLNSPSRGPMSRAAYKARVGAVVALGYLVNRASSEKALSYLLESVSPDSWTQRNLGNLSRSGMSTTETTQNLSKYAIIALGLSGHPKASERLRTLRDEERALTDDKFREKIKDVVTESLQTNEKVSRGGLLNYYKRRLQ
jgi:hypothetical protein